jgi:hypothetical protein
MDATTVTTGVEWHFIHRRSAVFDFMGCNEYACRAIDELDVLDRGANYYCGRGVGGWVSSPPRPIKNAPGDGNRWHFGCGNERCQTTTDQFRCCFNFKLHFNPLLAKYLQMCKQNRISGFIGIDPEMSQMLKYAPPKMHTTTIKISPTFSFYLLEKPFCQKLKI